MSRCCFFLWGQNKGLYEALNWNPFDLAAIIAHKPGPTSGASFESIMTMGSTFKCTQAQDRIYAVLSLVKDGPAIQPDYTEPVPKVFMEATCKTIALRRNLGIFSYIFHPNETSLQSLEEEDWPTWVSKWKDASVPPKFNKPYANLPTFASGQFQPPPLPSQASSGPVFNLRGFKVGSVQAVAPDRPLPVGIEDGPGAIAYMIQKVMNAWEIITKSGRTNPISHFLSPPVPHMDSALRGGVSRFGDPQRRGDARPAASRLVPRLCQHVGVRPSRAPEQRRPGPCQPEQISGRSTFSFRAGDGRVLWLPEQPTERRPRLLKARRPHAQQTFEPLAEGTMALDAGRLGGAVVGSLCSRLRSRDHSGGSVRSYHSSPAVQDAGPLSGPRPGS
jgi:hypothetical protein